MAERARLQRPGQLPPRPCRRSARLQPQRCTEHARPGQPSAHTCKPCSPYTPIPRLPMCTPSPRNPSSKVRDPRAHTTKIIKHRHARRAASVRAQDSAAASAGPATAVRTHCGPTPARSQQTDPETCEGGRVRGQALRNCAASTHTALTHGRSIPCAAENVPTQSKRGTQPQRSPPHSPPLRATPRPWPRRSSRR